MEVIVRNNTIQNVRLSTMSLADVPERQLVQLERVDVMAC